MVPDIKFARIAAIKTRGPISERIWRLFGHIAPRPPITIAKEPMLAKPQRLNTTIA